MLIPLIMMWLGGMVAGFYLGFRYRGYRKDI
jgi:hypothetical protein